MTALSLLNNFSLFAVASTDRTAVQSTTMHSGSMAFLPHQFLQKPSLQIKAISHEVRILQGSFFLTCFT